MIRALVLDAGGVLVHPARGCWNTPYGCAEYLGEYAPLVDTPQWFDAVEKYKHILREDERIGVDAEAARKREFLRSVFHELHWVVPAGAFDALALDFLENERRFVWYDDCEAVLQRLHTRLKIGILSDGMPSFRAMLYARPFAMYIDDTVISTEIGCTKPARGMYETIAARLNVRPDECLFTDDLEKNLRGAIACGMRAVQTDRGGIPVWDGDVVHSLSELENYVEKLL